MAEKVDLSMFRGDTKIFSVHVVDQNTKLPINITGFKMWCTVKKTPVEADSQALVQLDSAALGGIVFTDASRGIAKISIPALATRGLADGVCEILYDVQVKDTSNNIDTIQYGTITVTPDITRAVT